MTEPEKEREQEFLYLGWYPGFLFKKLHSYSVFQISYLVFFAALPLVYSESLVDPVLIPRQLFLTLFLVFTWACLFFTGKLKGPRMRVNPLSRLLILSYGLLIVLAFVSVFYSHTLSESLYVASKYGIIFLFFLTTCFLLGTGSISKQDLVNGVLIFLIISLCYGIYDLVLLMINDLDVLTHSFLITATYANKNLFASVLLLCCWAVFSADISRLARCGIIFILAVFVLLLQSKIVAAVVATLFLILALKNGRSYFKGHKAGVVAGVLLGFIAASALFLNFHQFENLASLHTLDTRVGLWRNSFEMICEHPFGVGVGNWQIFFSKYGLWHFDVPEVRNGRMLYHQPHNDFIWMLCELGFQGLLLYLSIFLIAIFMLIRQKSQSLPFLLLINLCGYCFVAFFDFPLERIEHQVLLSVILALSVSSFDAASLRHKPINFLKYSPAFLALIGVSLVVCCYRLKGEYFTRQFISADKKKYAGLVIENCNKAQSFFYSIDPISIPIDWHAGVALFNENKLEEAKLRFEKAYRYTPYHISVLNALGGIYEKTGNPVKAAGYYQEALKISPAATVAVLK